MSVMVQSGEQDLYDLGDKGQGFIVQIRPYAVVRGTGEVQV